ncbi:MAG: argininosuccinate lyase [Muribaculaceae bacterium]|nr:argininosuccinate lyase [Muribaculaceae bacterium]
MSKQLWNKGFEPDKSIESFTVGNDRELDLRLARYDVQGTMAHIKMLEKIGLLSRAELEILLPALEEISRLIEEGNFKIEEGVEDVHSQVEFLLTSKLGDIGKKIHSGRSRNDQVLVDLKLFFRDELKSLSESITKLFSKLLELSEKHKDKLMPGYTHLQIAMPSSFGLWFGAYAETLVDDMQLLVAAYNITNQNPLGSAAGYGSSFPLDREMTTELLEFESPHYNVVAAQMSRGKTEKAVASVIAAVASTLGHLAMDVCLWMCGNFNFISFPDELTTGSSIMPHKKNPDVFEIIRGKCNRLQSIPNEISLLTTNLPLGYNRDLQLLKDILFPATTELKECLDMATFMLENIKVKDDILDNPLYRYLFTVEDVNNLVNQGIPFRDAYKKIGMEVQNGTYSHSGEIKHTHLGSIGNPANDKIAEKMQKLLDKSGLSKL